MRNRTSQRQRGFVTVLALMLMAVLVAMGVSFAVLTNGSFQQASNLRNVQIARAEAESGLEYYIYALTSSDIPTGKTGADLLEAVRTGLAANTSLPGSFATGVQYRDPPDNTQIVIPSISQGSGRSFSGVIGLVAGDGSRLDVCVTGQNGTIARTLGMHFRMAPGGDGTPEQPGEPGGGGWFFGYGIASKSAISISGNAKITGANADPVKAAKEAAILSATGDDAALTMIGNAKLQGDVYFSNPDAEVSMGNNCTIGGVKKTSPDFDKHIHKDVGEIVFPEVDPTVFEAFATGDTITTASNVGKTLNNVRIKAGVNPTFSGNTTVNGVMYIEQPNKVTFAGNLAMKGVIATQDAGDDTYTDNTIKFVGNSSFQGVEALPDQSGSIDFRPLKKKSGAFILAPGFGLSFAGNFGTVNGTMAADAYSFTGNAGGTIKGMIINYSDSVFSFAGNASIIIDRSVDEARWAGTTYDPAQPIPGILATSGAQKMTPDGSTYYERHQ